MNYLTSISDRRLFFFRFWIKRPTQRQRDSSPSRFPRTEENYAVASSSRSTPNNYTINLSASSGFKFPNDFSQQQQLQQSRSRTYSDPWNTNLFLAPSSLENGSGGGGYVIRDKNSRRLHLAVPLVDQRLRETGFLLSPNISLWRSVSDALRHHRQSGSEDNRCLILGY